MTIIAAWQKNVMVLFQVSQSYMSLIRFSQGRKNHQPNHFRAKFQNMKDAQKFKQKSEVMMKRLHDVLDDVAKEKTMTIGRRNEVENETQKRKQELNNLQMLLHEKDKELNSIHEHYENVVSVVSKQENEMEKIRGF